jgi:REP-associated tyrosine transposase
MARIARVVVPDLPHHVTQGGNRRDPVFFEADDYRLYRRLVAAAARGAGAAVWAYCLMPNHVHLPIMPTWRDAGGRGWAAGDLRRGAPPLHRRRQRSVPMDGPSISGPLRRGGDGRAAPPDGNALHRAQSGGRGGW